MIVQVLFYVRILNLLTNLPSITPPQMFLWLLDNFEINHVNQKGLASVFWNIMIQ